MGKYQECRRCNSQVHAHAIQPLKRGSGGGFQKPHDQARCEKCKELGYNCRSYMAGGDVQEVDFEEGKSIISVASSTSTDVTEDHRGDITPTVSDDEDQVADYLEKKLKNFHI